jgi:hypothetical protein
MDSAHQPGNVIVEIQPNEFRPNARSAFNSPRRKDWSTAMVHGTGGQAAKLQFLNPGIADADGAHQK